MGFNILSHGVRPVYYRSSKVHRGAPVRAIQWGIPHTRLHGAE